MANLPVKIIIACAGLGRVRRGYESFADECFDALGKSERVAATLLHGPGKTTREHEFAVSFPSQHSSWLQAYAYLRARGDRARSRHEAFTAEQYLFGLKVARHAAAHGTDVILFSESQLGTILGWLRRGFGLRYRTLFSNGGPSQPPFPFCDHVQQLTPFYFEQAKDAGVPDSVQSLVPYGFAMSESPANDKAAIRRALNLPANRPVVLSVAAINHSHKRLDYLIDEVAKIEGERPYVLFVGQDERESAAIKARAATALGADNHRFVSLPHTEVAACYQASDLFVLTSLSEAFGRVLVEAMSHGLPCLVHDYTTTRYVLGEPGLYADFSVPGGLSNLLREALANLAHHASFAGLRRTRVRERFGWGSLLPAYEQMFFTAAKRPLT